MARKKTVIVGKQLERLEWEARFIVGKLRRGSSLTRKDQLNCLGRIGRTMKKYGLNSIKHLKPGHVQRYFAELRATGMSAGRMANHATAMRHLCRMMGKPDIVPTNKELGCARDLGNRTKHADRQIDPATIQAVRSRLSANHQIAFDMAKLFGLRQKETLLSCHTVERDGKEYLVVQGAKGGRPREVPITSAEQREVLAHNTSYRASHGGKLIDEDLSLQKGLKRLQNQLAAAGATRSSNANMHALRRQWIVERCQEILKQPEEERPQLIAELVEHVGHGRTEVLRAYTSLLT
ncbi:MAG TPA: hypothetical protein DCZ75_05295 [Geobacter sp.]|nr:hypothetical protein [Geobacter sp.]